MTSLISEAAPATTVQHILDRARKLADGAALDLDILNEAITHHMRETGEPVSIEAQRQLLSAAARAANVTAGSRSLPTPAPDPRPQQALLALGAEVMAEVTARIDLSRFNALAADEKRATLRDLVRQVVQDRRLQLNGGEHDRLAQLVIDDMLGYGPLQALLEDDTISDIMVNGPGAVYIERRGRIERSDIAFRDDAHVLNLAGRIVSAVGRRIDESQPLVDARLKDGSRVNIVIPPLAIDGPTITIRKFPARPLRLETLVEIGSMTHRMAEFLSLAAQLRLNILISGGTGSGKTTLLNAISGRISADERIVTLEDAAELQMQQDHVVRFETRAPNVEGRGEVTMRSLLRNALRMRPDRIIIGEIRGEEALDLLQAMNTGHDGSMGTLHANSPREALTRIESMCALAGYALPAEAIRSQLAHAVHLVIQVARMRDGKRRVTSISEVVGMEAGIVTLQDIFTFAVSPQSTKTTVIGDFVATGYRPAAAVRAAEHGLSRDLDAILGV